MGFLADINGIDFILEYLIKSSVVLSLSLFLTFLFRKRPASLRHLLLSVSLIGLLVLPFLSTLTSGWETRLLPSWQPGRTVAAFPGQKDDLINASRFFAVKSGLIPNKSVAAPDNLKTHRSPSLTTEGRASIVLGYCLLGLWSAVLTFLLLRTFLGLCGAMRLTKQGKNLRDPRWKQLLHRFLAVITLNRRVNLLSHEKVTIPFTWGMIKPVVIMPDASLNWEDDLRSTALFHELSHIKRSDFLIMILSRLSCILYWFNPLSWVVFKALRNEQEKACDELVLKTGIKPSTYAANLLSIKKLGVWKWNPTVAILGAAGKSQLNDRLLAILKIKFNPKEVKMKNKILLSLTVALAVILIGMARPSHSAINIDKSISSEREHFVKTQETTQEKNKAKEQEKNQSEKPDKKESQEKKCKEKNIKLEEKPIIILEKEDGHKIITIEGPHIVIQKGDQAPKHVTIHVKNKKGDKKKVVVAPRVKINALVDLQIKEKILQEKVKKIQEMVKEIVKQRLDRIEALESYEKYVSGIENKEIQEKLEKIFERLSQELESKVEIQAETLKKLEKSLEKLSEELEKKEKKHKKIDVYVEEKPAHVIIKHNDKVKKVVGDHIFVHKGEGKLIEVHDKEKGHTLIFKSKLSGQQKEVYTKAMEKLKSRLPEGYKVESEFDNESSIICITIKGDTKKEGSKEKLKELLRELKEELSKE